VTGLKEKELNFMQIGHIYDPLFCERSNGLKLPMWTQSKANTPTGQTVYELIVHLKTIAKNLHYNSFEKAKLTGGFLLGDILARLKTVAHKSNDNTLTKKEA